MKTILLVEEVCRCDSRNGLLNTVSTSTAPIGLMVFTMRFNNADV